MLLKPEIYLISLILIQIQLFFVTCQFYITGGEGREKDFRKSSGEIHNILILGTVSWGTFNFAGEL